MEQKQEPSILGYLIEQGIDQSLIEKCEEEKISSLEDFVRLTNEDYKEIGFKIGEKNKLKASLENYIEDSRKQVEEVEPRKNICHADVFELNNDVILEKENPELSHKLHGKTMFKEQEKNNAQQLNEWIKDQIKMGTHFRNFFFYLKSNKTIENFKLYKLNPLLKNGSLSQARTLRTLRATIETGSELCTVGSNAVVLFKSQMASNSNWMIAVISFGIEVGYHLKHYFSGLISGKMLAKKIVASAVFGSFSVVLGASGLALGAAIGTAICPGLGTMFGIILGILSSGAAGYFVSKRIDSAADRFCDTTSDEERINKEMMYQKSLKTLNVLETASLKAIEAEKKGLWFLYHPDRNIGFEQKAKEKFTEVTIAWECIKAYREENKIMF